MPGWDGERYAEVATLQHELGRRFAEALTPVAGSGGRAARVVDAGCGDGVVTRMIAALPWVGEVVGFDPSPLMVSTASSSGVPGVVFEAGDVTTFVAEEPFDLAVSLNALHWVRDSGAALTHLRDALRPGGRLVAQFVSEGARPSLEDVAQRVATGPAWASHFAGVDPPHVHRTAEEWRALAGGTGLTVSGAEVSDLAWDFGTAAAFEAWCTVGFTAWTEHLPADAHGAFVREVTAAYAEVAGSDHVFRFQQLRLEAARA
ncbi:methyltransferase domain-containing protein [Herbiconiux sp. VKM Ac-2851]|uniref:class I SAM-dependent methyltransferase n=1 Tax=Herbiconiux sp. VKM Ac-2851 TaxID=2739025 RepID=UPI001565C5E2|nr:methyltransferase domain-containing protein [Herbiconiux sp. VKM Ac-2851]NQX35024.1 methyltransferase domain-containing protein [Herbiconiux sp. VKM Ac-2851]